MNKSGKGDPPKKIDPIREMRERAMRLQEERQRQIEAEADDLVELYKENGYSFEEAMAELEVARRAALNKGDMGALVAATTAKAKLAGLMIDRQAVLHANAGSAIDFANDDPAAGVDRLKARAGDLGISTRVVERLIGVLIEEGVIRPDPPMISSS